MGVCYGIYCTTFTHAGGTLHLQQLDEQSLSADARYKTIRPGGSLNPAAHILSNANPRFRFRTCDILSVLTAFGNSGHLYCSGGHIARYQRREPGGAFETAANHFIQTSSSGFLHIESIDVDIDSEEGAYINLEYIPLSLQGENPIIESTGQSLLAAPVPAFMSQFYMGGLFLGAVQAIGLVRQRIVPGTRFVARRSDGGVFPRVSGSYIASRSPIIENRYLNAAFSVDAIGSFFLNALGASVKSYFQRGTTLAHGRIAAASASHIRVTAAAGSWGAGDLSVSGEGDAEVSVMVMPTGTLSYEIGLAIGA